MSDTYGAGDAPLVPGSVPQPDVNAPAQTGGLADQWRNWMSDPHNRAAMIQFGVSLSQPISAGQSALGHIGSAVGQAGEATDRITAEQRAEAEAESKQELRKSSAELASERAAHVGDVAAGKVEALNLRRSAQDLMDQSRVQKAYNDHLKLVESQNKEIRRTNVFAEKGKERPEVTPLTEEQFAARYRGMGATGNVAPVSAEPTQVRTPEDVKKLPSGTRYVTPDGRTGTAP